MKAFFPLIFLISNLFGLLINGLVWSQPENEKSEKSDLYQLEEILVTPGRFTISDRVRSVNVMPKSAMDKFPLIDNDIYRAVQILPGVVGSDFSARFQVRGGEKDEIAVRLDGMELYEPYHLQDFGGAVSNIDLGVVNRAELFTGGFGAEYGDKMSGVLEVLSRDGNREKLKGGFGFDLVNANMFLEAPISDKGSWLISARRGYADLIIDFISAISGSPEKLKLIFSDIYAKTIYDLTSKDKLSFNLLYAADSNSIYQDADKNYPILKSHYTNEIFWIKWHRRFGAKADKAFSEFFAFGGLASKDRKYGFDGIDKRDLSYFGLKDEFSYQPIASHTLKAGWQWRWSAGDYIYSENSIMINRRTALQIKDLQAQPQGWDSWAYLQDDWQLSKRLAADFGARYIYQNYKKPNGKSAISPRIAVALKAKKDLIFRAAWGIYLQPITPLELPIQNGVTELVEPERARHHILGCEYSPNSNLFLRAEGYYKKLDDLKGSAQEYDYAKPSQLFTSPNSGSAKGLELFGRMTFSNNMVGYLGYAYSIAKEKVKVRNQEAEYPRDSDQRHSFAVNFNYVLSRSFNINLGWRFHTGNPYTDIKYEIAPDEPSGSRKVFGETNVGRLPPYHSLDLRLSRSQELKNWQLNWYLQVLNLYNRKNIRQYSFEMEKYQADGLKIRTKRFEEHFFPIMPTLGVSGRF